MAGIPHVLVVTRGTREAERVVAPARILNDLEQRFLIHGVVLREQTGNGIKRSHQGTGRGRIDIALAASIEGAQAERLKVAALAPLHVDNMDELTRPDLVCSGGARLYVDVDQGLCQRRVRPVCRLQVRARLTSDIEHDLTRCTLLIDRHRTTWCAGHESGRRRRDERCRLPGTRRVAEQSNRDGPGEVAFARRERGANTLRGGGFAAEARLRSKRDSGSARANYRGVGSPRSIEDDQLARLSPLAIDHRHLVSGVEGHSTRSAARNRVSLDVGRQHGKPWDQHRSSLGRCGRNCWIEDHVNARPVLKSCSCEIGSCTMSIGGDCIGFTPAGQVERPHSIQYPVYEAEIGIDTGFHTGLNVHVTVPLRLARHAPTSVQRIPRWTQPREDTSSG